MVSTIKTRLSYSQTTTNEAMPWTHEIDCVCNTCKMLRHGIVVPVLDFAH